MNDEINIQRTWLEGLIEHVGRVEDSDKKGIEYKMAVASLIGYCASAKYLLGKEEV